MTDRRAPSKKTKICLQCKQPYRKRYNMSKSKFCGNDCAKDYMRAQGPARFWEKVMKTDTCWLYTGFKKWDGYGWIARSEGGAKYRWLTAHRYAWILTNGAVPDGMHVLHVCDVPACCNPAHLRLGSHVENMADMYRKGRYPHGERSRRNTLTLAQVLEMRTLREQGFGYEEIARRFGCRRNTAYLAITGRTWKSIDPAPVLHPERVRPRRET